MQSPQHPCLQVGTLPCPSSMRPALPQASISTRRSRRRHSSLLRHSSSGCTYQRPKPAHRQPTAQYAPQVVQRMPAVGQLTRRTTAAATAVVTAGRESYCTARGRTSAREGTAGETQYEDPFESCVKRQGPPSPSVGRAVTMTQLPPFFSICPGSARASAEVQSGPAAPAAWAAGQSLPQNCPRTTASSSHTPTVHSTASVHQLADGSVACTGTSAGDTGCVWTASPQVG